VLVVPEIPTEMGFDVLQVRGTPVMSMSVLSVTVAFKVVEVPVFTTKEVFCGGFPAALTVIDFTRQVSTGIGWLFRPLADA
jgi:hypothetical protein